MAQGALRGAILLGSRAPRRQHGLLISSLPMPRQSTWVDRQQRRHDSRFFRLLDGSFLFRLALSGAAAMALLTVVNSYATCRNNRWAKGCLWRDTEALISVGNVESLSIVTAAFLYVLEAQKRRQRDNIEAYELLMNCNASGIKLLVARTTALETLNNAGLPIDGQQLAGFDLRNLQAANGHWHNVNLEGTVLRRANLAGTDLSGANLRGADLRDADLRGAILVGADLEGALLEGAQLDGAELDDAQVDRASLDSGAPSPS